MTGTRTERQGRKKVRKGRARGTQVPSVGKNATTARVMGICREFVKIYDSRSCIEEVKCLRARTMHFLLEK
jgi:hypothetical protein